MIIMINIKSNYLNYCNFMKNCHIKTTNMAGNVYRNWPLISPFGRIEY